MKVSIIVAVTTFTLSCLIGLFSGAHLAIVLLRALIFAALYFGASEGIRRLAGRFLIQTLSADEYETSVDASAAQETSGALGGRVDISLGDEEADASEGLAVEEEAKASTDALSAKAADKGLDQGSEASYTEARSAIKETAILPPEVIGNIDVLPDLEGFSDSFEANYNKTGGDEDNGGSEFSDTENGPTTDQSERFNPTEMASAIRTLLKKDQKG